MAYSSQQIVVSVPCPEGWKVVDFRDPQFGESYLQSSAFYVKTWQSQSEWFSGPRFIVTKVNEVEKHDNNN